MSYVLDTTTVSALMRAEPAHSARLLAQRPADVFIPQPALAELHYGIARLPNSRRRRQLEERLAVLLAGIARSEWTDAVSRHYGQLRAHLGRRRQRIDDFDAAIAAHALALEAVVVTDNLRHFTRVPGLDVESWGEPLP